MAVCVANSHIASSPWYDQTLQLPNAAQDSLFPGNLKFSNDRSKVTERHYNQQLNLMSLLEKQKNAGNYKRDLMTNLFLEPSSNKTPQNSLATKSLSNDVLVTKNYQLELPDVTEEDDDLSEARVVTQWPRMSEKNHLVCKF